MAWIKENAIRRLRQQARDASIGACARYVRQAVEAGGVTLIRQRSAKDYGGSLAAVGFAICGHDAEDPAAADIAVIQPIIGHPHGHIAMFDGRLWISDFRQDHGAYPSSSYRQRRPPMTVYRYP